MVLLFLPFYLMGHINTAFPTPLTKEEEQKYIAELEAGSSEARDVLIEHNLRLVAHIAGRYSGAADSDDLISIGTIGLIKAVSTYKSGKGRLSTYAAECIKNAILSQMRLWFRINPLRAEKHQNGVFWHRFPRIFTYSAPLRRAM